MTQSVEYSQSDTTFNAKMDKLPDGDYIITMTTIFDNRVSSQSNAVQLELNEKGKKMLP